jgi:hypothetical protein
VAELHRRFQIPNTTNGAAEGLPPNQQIHHHQRRADQWRRSRRCAIPQVISANCETGFSDLTPAAYNAGPGRVSAWLTSHRPLPGESRNYVAIVTGWTTDEWASESPPQTADTTIPQGVPCTRLANLISAPKEEAKRIATYIPRWGGLRINVASVMFRLLLLIESLRFCAGLFV